MAYTGGLGVVGNRDKLIATYGTEVLNSSRLEKINQTNCMPVRM